jgi:dolichol-phosphate mannosyltransferase
MRTRLKEKVSVLIPTKNEPLIKELINEIHVQLQKIPHEIIIIDKSNVIPKIENAKLMMQKTDGLGNAILEGVMYSKGDVIVTMDGDCSHRPEDIGKLLKELNESDIVIGSKYVKGGKTEDKFYRIAISRIYCWFARKILGLSVKDNMSGFSAIKRKVFDEIKLNPLGFKINLEILYKAKKFKFKVKEVPIVFRKRAGGKEKGNFIEGIKTLIFILELKLDLR